MSSFTKFDSTGSVAFDKEASDKLGKEYWLVREGFTYYVGKKSSSELVEVPEGFLSDGASVPFIFKWLVPAMGRHSQAAILHDYLTETYYTIVDPGDGLARYKKDINRKTIDKIFYESLEVLEVHPFRRFLIRLAVSSYRIVRRPRRPKVDSRKTALEAEYRKQMTIAELCSK